ncbi:thioredoxin family protein [Aestuariibaculum lutulentum]|uniref:Thioredoxin fold domain-containing protein n=1 Tax=Aestuariibaculum lutulentum TaxID=2920935 RepID=A0ABS9RJC6_9FLAO|nr:thioredoxin fold domain-containing protein [Aestuariibaculum lutulentum]MCH4553053.1 thioredoxin fold domain-containing protein [Aestuariibaculum lutulentum]
MKNFYKIIVLAITFLLSCSSFSQTKFIKASWEEVLMQAKKENKLIFVDLYFTGCFPCKQMDDKVFPDSRVAEVLNTSFIAFKSDIFKEDIGKKIARKYGVTGFPSFIVLDANGNTIEVTSGYHSVEELVAVLELAKSNESKKQFKAYSKKIQGDYPQFYNDAYLKNKRQVSFEVVDAYLKSQKNLSEEIPFLIITGLRIGGEYADYIIENATSLSSAYGHVPVRNYIASTVNLKAKVFANNNDIDGFNKLLSKVKPHFTESEWERFSAGFDKTFEKNKGESK